MMFKKDIKAYIEQQWEDDSFVKSLSEISKSDGSEFSLVDLPEEIYCFDDISKAIHRGDANNPASVDGLFFVDSTAYFVEFKTGFKRKITKENFSEEKMMCPEHNHVCEDYKTLFFRTQEMEIKELRVSIRFKAIDSYMTLEKKIIPHCNNITRKCRICLIVVIDENEIDNYESELLELSGEHASPISNENNCFCSLQSSLQGYKGKKDDCEPSNDYFYDDIMVFSAEKFKRFIKEHHPSTLNI